MFGLVSGKPLAALLLSLAAGQVHAAFDIKLNFDNVQDTYKSYFAAAESYWESMITGYQQGISLNGPTISVVTPVIDGIGKTLGGAGPQTGVFQSGYGLVTTGRMEFDIADIGSLIQSNSFVDVIKHEMAHVLGFGTLWQLNNVYVGGTGQYNGAFGLAAYRSEFGQPGATFVPVELEGGPGTANGHWNEGFGGGVTGIQANGKDLRNELMTGWLNTPVFVSRTTIESFRDIGFTVTPVPEPESLLLFAFGLPVVAGLGVRRRRRMVA